MKARGLFVECGRGEPWVAFQLFDCAAFAGVITEELQDQIFEVGGEAGAIDFFEVLFGLVCQKQVVEVVFWGGFFERKDTLHNDEDYDSDRKEISLPSVVSFIFI